MNKRAAYWAVVPAAGIGRRMGADIPKQYLQLRGRTVIEHTLGRLCAPPHITAVVVAISESDTHWPNIDLDRFPKPVTTVPGGVERCHSVLNALALLRERAADGDWVLVHDAARPCLRLSDIDHLIATLSTHPVGGLLGVPVSDTMKRTNAGGEIQQTVDRTGLWRALTPQMFRLECLHDALQKALADRYLVTDEASAMEHCGYAPLMVEGHGDNIKITRPGDLPLAEMYLTQQERAL